MWFPRSTGAVPITATLAKFEKAGSQDPLKGKFALVRFPAEWGTAVVRGSMHSEIILAAATAGATAVLAVTEGATKRSSL